MKKVNNNYTDKDGLISKESLFRATIDESILIKRVNKIKGLEPYSNYLILSDGRLYNLETDRFLRGGTSQTHKYTLAGKTDEGKSIQKRMEAHRLVALAFVPNDAPDVKTVASHIDRDRLNNDYTNLIWISKEDSLKRNTAKRGSDCNKKKKIIAQDVVTKEKKIFESMAEASRKLGIDKNGIYRCINGLAKTSNGFRFTLA